ncbi:aminotransferase class V-fold PLP-dependent enzyme [Pedobacter caeni]|uniref:DegT/DnrJ/EryC1/StrS aminotransferase family protein n=1 Tax=Pedobacter caeni TaxID=288992 RepID=A0A1M5JWV8_9SPHI|nr:aminotransferase class V-fold PLP-dependent enzyme [Pedobacter caeni]SHG44790.1 DegT/DnrJ/EryC1/StrS aminotransferase family protein [Pedobacter caeni]
MIPRGKLDIPFSDIFAGIRYCFSGYFFPGQTYKNSIAGNNKLVTLSVRTGFNLLLKALDFPPGTEILVTDINIPDMFNIIAAHQLIAVPVSIDKYSLTITAGQVSSAITPATKAILITHLFGGITPLKEIQEIAKKNQLILIEDCAQAFQGNGYEGHPESDVLMFSFGMIKTNTAISGAVIQINTPQLYLLVKEFNNQLPRQKTRLYLKKLIKAMCISLLGKRTWYTLFYQLIQSRGKDFDQVLSSFTRGFPGDDPLKKIRFRPCHPNERLLEKRLNAFKQEQVWSRKRLSDDILENLPGEIRIGCTNQLHTNWVIPIQCPHPEEMIRHLRVNGFDATSKASSLIKLNNSETTKENANALSLTQLVYLPMDTSMSLSERHQLGRLIREKLSRTSP